MRSPRSSLEQQFLKKWIMGLQVCDSAKQNMSILERKKAIKLSADIAIASTRNGMTCWSRALLGKALKDDYNNKLLIENILASDNSHDMKLIKKVSSSIGPMFRGNKRVIRSKKILKKIRRRARRTKNTPQAQMVVAKSLARKIVKKRTQVLKSLVPGGELMDDVSLIEETLDYIASLRAQVDVMRTFANATELLNGK